MSYPICVTCGTQFAASAAPPERCPICDDERQYVGHQGQLWTTMDALRAERRNEVREVEPDLIGIGTTPSFAIGQRALLVRTPGGNILWDCLSLLDDATIEAVRALGGIRAIAISHPHYYSAMVEWAHAFDAPIYLHAAEREWVMRPDPAIHYWEGDTFSLDDGVTIVRCGGHYAGGQVLYWAAGAEGRGVFLTGDILQVVSDRRYLSFMYSYPNLIPLPPALVRRIVAAVEPFPFERIYGAWWDRIVADDAKAAVRRSAERYIAAIEGTLPNIRAQLAGDA
jgi:hypothetical protein